MTSHEKWVDLIDDTLAVLQADQATLTPQNGKGLLDEWMVAVGEGANTAELTNALNELKTLLESGLEPERINAALQPLADQTAAFSTTLGAEGDMSTRIDALASALRVFGSQLGKA